MTTPVAVFTHIPKTGGSSFNTGVYSLLGGSEEIHIIKSDDDDVSTLMPRVGSVRFIGGHIRFPIAYEIFGDDAVYFAALRDPIDRLCSHYFFATRYGGLHPSVFKFGLRRGFDAFYKSVIVDKNRTNLQCRFFCDGATATGAIAAIQQHYALAWDSRVTDLAWTVAASILAREQNLTGCAAPPLRPSYVAPVSPDGTGSLTGQRPQSYREFLGSEAVAQLLHDNSEDVRLHEWLIRSGGVVQRRFHCAMGETTVA